MVFNSLYLIKAFHFMVQNILINSYKEEFVAIIQWGYIISCCIDTFHMGLCIVIEGYHIGRFNHKSQFNKLYFESFNNHKESIQILIKVVSFNFISFNS